MPNSGDFRVSGLIVVLVIVPLFTFLIRRKWRIAARRREEIIKLVVLASEEAARAELEAAAVYSVSAAAAALQQCAVCYCPTTTRCSRCKAVRYCSGKCQIIHWRQGHREECRTATTTVEFNSSEGGAPDSKSVLQADNLDPQGKSLETEGKWHAEVIKVTPEKPKCSKPRCSSTVASGKNEVETNPLDDVPKTGRISINTSVSSSGSSTTCESPVSGTSTGPNTHLSEEIGPGTLSKAADVDDPKRTKLPPVGFSSPITSVNSTSCSNKLAREISNHSDGVVDCSSTSSSVSSTSLSKSSHVDHSESGSPSPCFSSSSGEAVSATLSQCSSNPRTPVLIDDIKSMSSGKGVLANSAAPLKKPVMDVAKCRNSPVLGSERLIAMVNEESTDASLHKYGSQRSLSRVSSVDVASSVSVEKSVPSVISPKVDSVDLAPTCSSGVASSAPNGGNGLKTSVLKVVQQFRASKLPKHNPYPLGFGNEISGKLSTMLFPYDLFVKLYNCDKVELRPCGLTNCGNSCYANAVLQCLAFTRPLTAYLLQGLHTKSCSKKEWCFTCEFESLVLKAKEGKCPLSPIRILSQMQSIGSNLGYGREEDAHEFLRYAIDTMQSVCLKEAGANAVGQMAKETTLIQLAFGGYLRSNIKCLRCQGKSERHERMMDLTVEIHGDIGTLEEALAQFTATEILDGDNKYQCDRCKSYEKAKKKLTVYEAPNILTIALKRFQSGKFGKLNKFVRFPEILNLAPYMSGTGDKSPVYRLYAVVVHLDVMNASFSGHYVCYVKNLQGKWYKIDDSKVKPVEFERVLSKGAYMLLYARCSPRPPSLIRNGVVNDHSKTKKNRHTEPVVSNQNGRGSASKTRPNYTVPNDTQLAGFRMREDRSSFWMPRNVEAFDSFDERFSPINRILKTDNSSDNSSLFSCSDEGSWSTESTRDSTSTDEYSEYIFGDSGSLSWNSPIRVLEDSDGLPPSTVFSNGFNPGSPGSGGGLNFSFLNQKSIHSEAPYKKVVNSDTGLAGPNGDPAGVPRQGGRKVLQDEGNPSFFYLDPTSSQFRKKSIDCCSSSGTDPDLLDWVHPCDEKSDVPLRRCGRDRRTQKFS